MTVDVVILAGAQNTGLLKEYTSEKYEALINIKNKTMVDYVIKAVKNAENTGRVVLVGPEKELKNTIAYDVDIIINYTDSMLGNVQKGVKALNTEKQVMIITSDIPLVNSEIIDKFLTSCQKNNADIYYPIITRKQNLDKFPEIKRTYVRLADDTFTGGNMIVIKPIILKEALQWLEKVIAWRKKPWKLSQLLGFKFIVKFIIGRLTLQEVEKRVSEIVGYRAKALIFEDAEVGFDVDKPLDLKLMREKYIL